MSTPPDYIPLPFDHVYRITVEVIEPGGIKWGIKVAIDRGLIESLPPEVRPDALRSSINKLTNAILEGGPRAY